MNKLSPQRKKVVVLASAIACMSGMPVLLNGHPRVIMAWIGLMAVGLVVVIVEFAKLKRQGL
jgi:hypothetical protein